MPWSPFRALPLVLVVLALAGATPARAQYDTIPTTGEDSEIDHFRRNSALLGAVSLTTIVINSEAAGPKPSPGWSGALGFFAGGFQIVLGAQKVSKDSVVAALDMFVGGAAMLTSISALARGREETRASLRKPGDGVGLAPLVGLNGALEPEAGVALSF